MSISITLVLSYSSLIIILLFSMDEIDRAPKEKKRFEYEVSRFVQLKK